MTSSNDQLIREGHKAIKRGEKEEARKLLQEAAKQNPADHRVWLGLAAVAATPQQSLAFIEKAADLNPNSAAIEKARKWAEAHAAKQPNHEIKAPPTAEPVRERPKPPPKKELKTEPILPPPSASGLTFRRVIGVTALLGLVIAMGIVAWFAYTTWMNGNDLAAATGGSSESTPTSAEIALVPDTEVSNILPELEENVATVVDETPTPNPLQPKNIIQEAGEPRPRWTTTPLPTQTPTPSPTWVPTFVSPLSEAGLLQPLGLLPNERWIDVDLSNQRLVAYEGDTAVFETLVSTGLRQYPTVIGQFRIWLRYLSQTMDGSRLGYDYYLENVQYVQYFFEDYALHGTYWHSNFGNPMSHGCVNLSNQDAEWLYNFANYGTVVNVHE